MDTTAAKKAAKKRRLREKRAAAHIPTAAEDTAISNLSNPPAIISLNASDTATTAMEYPDKAIKDLWRLVARRAAKQAWQDKYAKKQRRMIAASAPKQLLCTAPIAVYTIVEPTAATPPAKTDPATAPAWLVNVNDDCDTVA